MSRYFVIQVHVFSSTSTSSTNFRAVMAVATVIVVQVSTAFILRQRMRVFLGKCYFAWFGCCDWFGAFWSGQWQRLLSHLVPLRLLHSPGFPGMHFQSCFIIKRDDRKCRSGSSLWLIIDVLCWTSICRVSASPIESQCHCPLHQVQTDMIIDV